MQLLLLPVLCAGQTVSLVSRSTGADGAVGDAESGTSLYGVVRSPVTDGGDVFLLSLARLDSLIDANFVRDIYRRSGTTTSVISVSEFPPDTDTFGNAFTVSVSAGGEWAATVRPANDFDNIRDTFLWDLTNTPFVRSSLVPDTVDVTSATLSGNGLFVVLDTASAGLAAGDNNGRSDVFLYSTVAQTTVWVNAQPDGTASNGDSYAPAISDTGDHVVFLSTSTDLGAGTSRATVAPNAHVYFWDLGSSSLRRIDQRIDGTESSSAESCGISGDGAWVAFSSPDGNIVNGDSNGDTDVFLRSADGAPSELVSVATSGVQADAASGTPSVSRDGRFVAFTSLATNLSAGDTNGKQQVYLRDRSAGTTVLLSRSATDDGADSNCFAPAISPDGRYVTFASAATNLGNVTGPAGVTQVFLVDQRDTVFQELTLATGWNLVSFKMDPVDSTPAIMFSRTVGPTWYWDTGVGAYRRTEKLVGGQGYWVYVAGDPFVLTAVPGSSIANVLRPVFQGWNLVGPVGSGTSRDLPEAGGKDHGTTWYWDATHQRYEVAERMAEGLGYWIYSLADLDVDLGME
ncbi:MAG: hypothetical protein HN976_02560 [Lentisphaerae bacterium]|nr:hypothetical protein [Lentisphaerota bacterium]